MASDSPAPKPSRRATRLGRYEILQHIATGGMGAVYKARDVELGRDVALKVLANELANQREALERFRREARSAARLRHENIVTLYECGEVNGTYFLALEFVDGIDLHDYITQKGQLEPGEARQILAQAARALDHAHKQGIVHRDIKPSNFLIAHEGEQLVVKLTDLGLARLTREDEFRVTRSGSTVGTVDYISPEQARDSAAADVRSDIYSLGCTLYHMLAGQAPFPDGSLTERLFKHLETEPPDVRRFNPKVSAGLAALLRKMLAKKPEDRYQTPAELLQDLTRPDLDKRADPPAQDPARAEQTAAGGKAPARPGGGRKRRARPDTDTRQNLPPPTRSLSRARPKRRRQPGPIFWLAGAVGLLLLVVAVLAVFRFSRGTPAPDPDTAAADNRPAVPVERPAPVHVPGPDRTPKPEQPPEQQPQGKTWPALYRPPLPLDVPYLQREMQAPWAAVRPPPADAPVLRVSRLPRPGSERDFDSLAAACAAAPADRVSIIEIDDNGPLFQTPAAVTGRSLVLRPGKGYRPLVVWDVAASKPAAGRRQVFLSVNHGDLTLEDLDVAVRWPDVPEPACLFRVVEGDFLARGCTIAQAGKPRAGVTVVAQECTATEARRCRLSRCLVRGTDLVALDLQAPTAEVLLDGCLVTGGDRPLLRLAAGSALPTTLRLWRSTLVSGRTCLQLRPAGAGDTTPKLRCNGWDALLARSGTTAGGELLALDEGAGPGGVEWQALNCLYAGWQKLLAGRESVPATDLTAFRKTVHGKEGDGVEAKGWPAVVYGGPAEAPPETYRTDVPPVAFAATSGPGTLGCDLAALPPAREDWVGLTAESFAGRAFEFLQDDAPPEIPRVLDGRYHGERLDLERTPVDLGEYLRRMEKERQFGPKVVLHLAGTGVHSTSPIHVKGASLVLFVEPPAAEAEPLVLHFPGNAAGGNAGIEVEDGSLEISGGTVRCADFASALLPAFVVGVKGGDLRLFHCRLEGPVKQPSASYRGLVSLQGSGDSNPQKAHVFTANESVLLSGKAGIHLDGSGGRAALRGCLLLCGGEAVHIEPGRSAKPRLAVQCLLEQTTVAAKEAVLRLGDAPELGVPVEPAVMQTKACALLNPFAGGKDQPARAGLLRYEGDALTRGLLAWRSEGDVFDRRLQYGAAPAAGPLPDKAESHSLWAKLWGTPGDVQPFLDLPPTRPFDGDKLQFDRLVLPAWPRFMGHPPGADLARLGLLKKAKKP
jgi:tRNA A-37 threonylcarbamoyl transferase component Bud32